MPEMDKNNLWFLALRFRPWKVARDNSPIYMNSISGYPVSGLAHHQQYGIPNPIGSPFPSLPPAVTGLKFPCLTAHNASSHLRVGMRRLLCWVTHCSQQWGPRPQSQWLHCSRPRYGHDNKSVQGSTKPGHTYNDNRCAEVRCRFHRHRYL